MKAKVAEYQSAMPQGYKVAYPKDSTDFINISIEEVVKTLFEAVALVVVVMFVFLQNLRTTLIPTITVPVVLLGTFGVLAAFGYSINTLTLFGMVLAIGLLVDDAIVVVENVERVMREDKLPPREATEKSMREITGALVGIALVLSAVFLPMAFFGGSTGVIYRQFSITVVSSMVLSVVLALTLAPALCATLLKPAHDAQTDKGLLGKFNRGYDRLQEKYADKVGGVIHRPTRYLLLYGLLLIAAAVMYLRLPTGFLPNEDQGTVMVQYTLPAGATNARTSAVSEAVTAYFLNQEKANVSTIFTINGFGFSGSGQNAGMAFVSLKDWSQRSGSENTADAIAKRAMAHFASLRDAPGLLHEPAGDRRLRPVRRLYLRAAGQRGDHPRRAAGDARSDRRRRLWQSVAVGGARQHLAGHAAAAGGDRQRQTAGARPERRRRQQHAQQRVRQHLRQRLYRSQPGEKGLYAGAT